MEREYINRKIINPIFTTLWNNVNDMKSLANNYERLYGNDDIYKYLITLSNNEESFNQSIQNIYNKVMNDINKMLPVLLNIDNIYNSMNEYMKNIGLPLEPLANVVCVKVDKIRPNYNNLQIWMNDPNNVYIGRRGIVFIDKVRFPPHDSVWANPFKIDKDGNRDQVIQKYKEYILSKPELLQKLPQLKGKTLGCWCSPEKCHGDVLKELSSLY
jgi:hypothetical protein